MAPPGIGIPPHLRFINENGTLTRQPQPPGNKKPNEAVMFDIFHHGQPAEAVVVGSRITLSFTPYYAIPRKLKGICIMVKIYNGVRL